MMRDKFGNRVVTGAAESVRAIDRFADEFLGYGPGLPDILGAADRDPDSPSLNHLAASVHLAAESGKGKRHARTYLRRAEAASRFSDEREQHAIRAVRAWLDGDYPGAARLYERIARRWPQDVVSAKWGQYHCFNMGDSEGILRLAEAVLPVHCGTPYVHGMHAFGLEQCGRLTEAENAARFAVEVERADPWAHHALAHVMDTEGRVDEGIAFMRGISGTWEGKGKFIRHHNWWHVGLFHIDRKDPEGALDIFDRHLWGIFPEFGQEQIGAISTLWRLELRGVDVGERWAPVAEKVLERGCEHIQPFLDMHYVYALVRGGHHAAADAFIASLARHARHAAPAMRRVWGEAAAPVVRGIAAHARGDYDTAYTLLKPVMTHVHLLGGSHAQRDILHQTWMDILLRSHRYMRAAGTVARGNQPRIYGASAKRRLQQALRLMRRPSPVPAD